jgi:hypothetical protein
MHTNVSVQVPLEHLITHYKRQLKAETIATSPSVMQ